MSPSQVSPATSVMCSPTAARKISASPDGFVPGLKNGRHERVRVEVALEVELGAVVPAVPDGPDGEDHLAHARRGVRPLHREPLGDVGLDLAAEAEHEPALRVRLQVPGDLRQRHRVAGEGDGDAGAELDLLGVLARRRAAGRTDRGWSRPTRSRRSPTSSSERAWSPALSSASGAIPNPPSTFMGFPLRLETGRPSADAGTLPRCPERPGTGRRARVRPGDPTPGRGGPEESGVTPCTPLLIDL